MKHATTNYRALMKLIEAEDPRVRDAYFGDYWGDRKYYLYKDRDRFTVSINPVTRTARPLAISFDGYEVQIFKSTWLYNPKRVSEADALLHDWLYPKQERYNGRIEGFKSLIPYM